MDLGLKGKVAVVTGGTQGIGRASALRFAQEGANVAICARNADRLEQTAAELRKTGVDVVSMSADCSKAEDIERFIGAVVKKFGRIDILVNNAGESMRGKFLETGDEKWSADIELKVFGAIRCSRLAIPHMKKQGGGRIINITISSAKQPGAESMPTSVSRAAGLAITKALSKEFAAGQHPRQHRVHRQDQVRPARATLHARGQERGGILQGVRQGHTARARGRSRRSRERHRLPRLRCRELRDRDQHQPGRGHLRHALNPHERRT